jgi:hypothetical protein
MMKKIFRRPLGFITKEEFAKILGVCIKTIDRRLKTEPMLQAEKVKLEAGQRVWINKHKAIEFFEHCQARGRV